MNSDERNGFCSPWHPKALSQARTIACDELEDLIQCQAELNEMPEMRCRDGKHMINCPTAAYETALRFPRGG